MSIKHHNIFFGIIKLAAVAGLAALAQYAARDGHVEAYWMFGALAACYALYWLYRCGFTGILRHVGAYFIETANMIDAEVERGSAAAKRRVERAIDLTTDGAMESN